MQTFQKEFCMLRTVHSLIKALGDAAGIVLNTDDCPFIGCDPNCFSDLEQMSTWFYFTPEFTMIIFLLSSPLALLVALWGMTSERMLNFIYFSQKSAGKRESERALPKRAANVSIPQRAGSDKCDS